MNNNILGGKHATPQKPVTLQVQVVVCPQVWNSKTVPVPVEPMTVTLWSYLYLCYTLAAPKVIGKFIYFLYHFFYQFIKFVM